MSKPVPSPADEAQAVAARYARRMPADPRYHPLNPVQLHALQERERALARLLRQQGLSNTAGLRALELGCGTGGNLLTLLRLGFQPQHLTGLELLPERAAAAQSQLPATVTVLAGDASQTSVPAASQDLVLAFTVFSSVLSDAVQQHLADALWRWLKPGGSVLLYDFVFNNPANPDVRAVPVARMRQLFPQGTLRAQALTLAPPLARRLPAWALPCVNALPWLRTHRLVHIRKP